MRTGEITKEGGVPFYFFGGDKPILLSIIMLYKNLEIIDL